MLSVITNPSLLIRVLKENYSIQKYKPITHISSSIFRNVGDYRRIVLTSFFGLLLTYQHLNIFLYLDNIQPVEICANPSLPFTTEVQNMKYLTSQPASLAARNWSYASVSTYNLDQNWKEQQHIASRNNIVRVEKHIQK